MALATYRLLALKWQPSQKADKVFLFIACITVAAMLILGGVLSSIDVPEKSRNVKAEVPERVAKFINKKPKPPQPKPKVPKPKPKPKPKQEEQKKPKVERPKPTVDKKPLTATQVKARDKVKDLGMLKHLSELNDMIETPVSAQLKTDIKKTTEANVAANHDISVLTSNATKGSGGVNGTKYATQAGSSTLSAAELASAQAVLDAGDSAFANSKDDNSGGKGRTRSEEEIILVIDRHKSQLQGLYNRERRKNPSLKGLLVLEITILPNGTVASVKIKSSELNAPQLESSMVARIKKLEFGVKDVDSVTVSYPIEFLP